MNRVSIFAREAALEIRQTISGPQIPLMVLGLVGYLLIVVANADYMREMGAADITRNSPHLVYLMTSGEGMWLIFAFAWVFAQIVTRDRDAHLHEMVLVAPVSLRGLLVARFVGAFVVACILGLATPLAFLLIPALESISVLPPGSVGPTPWHAIFWSFAVFVIPTALGLGLLYAAVAIRTRSTAGPFATAAGVVIIWMIAMVIIRGGGLDRDLATWLDPTGFAEAEHQTDLWTPAEKMTSLLAFSRPLAINRLIWTVAPLLFFVRTLVGLHRESLTVARAQKPPRKRRPRRLPSTTTTSPRPTPSFTVTSWWRATMSEAAWHLALSARGWGFRLIAFVLVIVGVAGSVVHLVAHLDGPFVPRPEVLTPLLAEFSYLGIVFVIAGLVGAMARRDDRLGFVEIADSTPVPVWVRVAGRTFAAGTLTLLLAALPMISGWIVTALFAPSSFDLAVPFFFGTLSFFPALLEVCAITLLVHAIVRSAGVAHALAMLVAFIAVVNHELSLVAYPPYQVAIPTHITLSELAGFSVWWGPILTTDAFKLGVVLLCIAGAWLGWRRGTAVTLGQRVAVAARRLRGGAGVLGAAGIILLVASGSVLHDRLVVHGEFADVEDERVERAGWEQRWWRHAAPFSVGGGALNAVIRPATREVEVAWRIENVRSDTNQLHLALPHGVSLDAARSSDVDLAVEQAFDHAVVALDGCNEPCAVDLSLSAEIRGWPAEGGQPWISSASVDARAADFVPTLGHEAERVLRGPALREGYGLPPFPRSHLPGAFRSALGVAPVADWTVEVVIDDGEREVVVAEARRGPLDFAVVWPSDVAMTTQRGALEAHHGETHRETAREILEDTAAMQACVETTLGQSVDVRVVYQAPREAGPIALHASTLWIPEDEGWDAGSDGVSRWQRRAALAHAFAAHALVEGASLRTEPGYRWLTDGIAGWVGLECVRTHDGTEAWHALMERRSDRVAEALGALDAPLRGFALDGEADWVPQYAPLAAQGWAMTSGKDDALRRVAEIRVALTEGQSVVDALQQTLGAADAAVILGPPHASDVALQEQDDATWQVRGHRWTWADGGWGTPSDVDRFTQVAHPLVGDFRPVDVPNALDRRDSVAVFDAWPSFERAPKDNFWPESATGENRKTQ